jgi:hypothetical protein
MENDSIFTLSERTVRKYTVYQAEQSALRYLTGKGYKTFCKDSTKGRAGSEKITLEELNKIADRIIADSKKLSTKTESA